MEPTPTNVLNDRIAAIKILLEAFKMERMIYTIILCVSIIAILSVAVYIIIRDPNGENITLFVGLFVPAGAISFSVAQILKMWNQAIRFVMGQQLEKDDK